MRFRCFLCRLVSEVDQVADEEAKAHFVCGHCQTKNRLARVEPPHPDADQEYTVVGIDLGGDG